MNKVNQKAAFGKKTNQRAAIGEQTKQRATLGNRTDEGRDGYHRPFFEDS